ncbi:MAG: cupin domain-containing protein [Henriciella sp.]
MELNADFTKRAIVHSQGIPWTPSPLPGVERRMLDRIGEEVARATTIVRYAPGSSFSAHTHDGGEEYLVLEGVFQDEHGNFPVGTYVRNPPTSRHTPRADSGAVILVKLWQFDPEDRHHQSTDTLSMKPILVKPGVAEIPLYRDNRERVRIEEWSAESEIEISGHLGFEALVLDGEFDLDGETFGQHSWVRLPPNDHAKVRVGDQKVRLWIKSDHLSVAQTAPGRN